MNYCEVCQSHHDKPDCKPDNRTKCPECGLVGLHYCTGKKSDIGYLHKDEVINIPALNTPAEQKLALKQAVMDYYAISEADLFGDSHRPAYSLPRQALMYYAYQFLGISWSVIGAWLNRNHSTIINGHRKWGEILKKNPQHGLDKVMRSKFGKAPNVVKKEIEKLEQRVALLERYLQGMLNDPLEVTRHSDIKTLLEK